ncbi:hypothetical protein [Demequina rhizosphaerae]|uniref:hypothetical protein n=1 Tax=Demequina rhizosphaerae TaxID=1638985 RepID=UPI000786663F|nr:hypothetical protein [Demequina rhizosphaerae]
MTDRSTVFVCVQKSTGVVVPARSGKVATWTPGDGRLCPSGAARMRILTTNWDGATGADGADGVDGLDGLDGKSAYEIAVDNGFEGAVEEWLASLQGSDGSGATVTVTPSPDPDATIDGGAP